MKLRQQAKVLRKEKLPGICWDENSKKNKKTQQIRLTMQLVCLFVCYGISTFVGYLMPNPFLYKRQFYIKQFSLA